MLGLFSNQRTLGCLLFLFWQTRSGSFIFAWRSSSRMCRGWCYCMCVWIHVQWSEGEQNHHMASHATCSEKASLLRQIREISCTSMTTRKAEVRGSRGSTFRRADAAIYSPTKRRFLLEAILIPRHSSSGWIVLLLLQLFNSATQPAIAHISWTQTLNTRGEPLENLSLKHRTLI